MNEQETLYAMALTLLPGLSKETLCEMVRKAGSAVQAYEMYSEPNVDEDAPVALHEIVRTLPDYLDRARREWDFMQEKGIESMTLLSSNYPDRMKECSDAPLVLYYKGVAPLNTAKVICMVGTRRCTEYGRDLCRNFLHDLAQLCPDVLVVSGLAYGVDVQVHQHALQNALPTVGVLAHGLDMLYPSSHKRVANEMVKQGGLLTEFMSGSNSDKFHFVQRNRIVAGMADACIVVESQEKGGSLITADLAAGYYRDVFAFPGRVGDECSLGCNRLIADNKAVLLLNAQDFVQAMNWESRRPTAVQRSLFVELTPDEERIVNVLKKHDALHVNQLLAQCGLPIQQLHALLLELELKGVIKALVGSQYHLLS